ncbi:hypothetical protein STFE110948_00935 [Streptobacillus felis]|uniref:Uncharacterized protein n=1 Tax=Streptobacillus felis TaxID=1384509 RepID=A0A7Z0PFM7_9FUSO|nr:hypothetical protein [Streptobacillus felis]NYV27916.1 hypothetical protein [Streptobacillus felis]
MNNKIKKVIYLILFVLFFKLIVDGQKTVGLKNLGLMLVGLFGLIALLWEYNRGQK